MRPVTIGLVQINGSFAKQSYVPYSVGLLQAYAQRHARRPERYRFLTPVFQRQPIRDIVAQLAGADVVAISAYVWNEQVSLEVARRIKALAPATLVVLGGPQVPAGAEAFLRGHPMVDVVVHGEGEVAFLDLIENVDGRAGWHGIANLSFLDADLDAGGAFVTVPERPRLRDLDAIPSPYLAGTFDPLFAAHPGQQWTALWETNRGCPFSCSFCDWGSNTAAKVVRFSSERLFGEMAWFAARRVPFVYCCDANFGILPRDYDIAVKMAENKRDTGFPQIFSVQNTKNATDRSYATQKVLAGAGLSKGVSLSMQSTNPETLRNIKRDNIHLDTFDELQYRFTRDGVDTYSELIIGLPGDTYDSFADSVDYLISKGQHNRIRFNNLCILPNAEMGDAAYQATHGLETVRIQVVNGYGEQADIDDDVPEYQDMVIATRSMPREMWRRIRVFGWMTDFLHFDKMMQVPFVALHVLGGARYRDLIELFLDADAADFPIIAEIGGFLRDKAVAIQDGDFEYCLARQFMNSYWKPDEVMAMRIVTEGRLPAFYEESGRLLRRFLAGGESPVPDALLSDALALNLALLKQPNRRDDVTVVLSADLIGLWRGAVLGQKRVPALVPTEVVVLRSRQIWETIDDWCREVVWYGNRTGSYFYDFEVRSAA